MQFINGLPVVSKKHQLYNGATGKYIAKCPVVEEQRYTSDIIMMQVAEDAIDIYDNDKKMVTIDKEKEDEPMKAWIYYDISLGKQHYLYIEYEDGRLVNYIIDEPLARYEVKWSIKTHQEKKIEQRNSIKPE